MLGLECDTLHPGEGGQGFLVIRVRCWGIGACSVCRGKVSSHTKSKAVYCRTAAGW
jgi:hypothetical protein